MSDMDVRQAMRVFRTHGFEGVSVSELNKFCEEIEDFVARKQMTCKHDFIYESTLRKPVVGSHSTNRHPTYWTRYECPKCDYWKRDIIKTWMKLEEEVEAIENKYQQERKDSVD